MSRTVQAPPWLARLLTPLIARMVAREMARRHPELTAEQIAARMRAEIPSGSDARALEMVDEVAARLPESPATTQRPPALSAAILVVANLVPLYGVLFWGWEVFPLLLLFWAENVIVGVLNVARMLCVDPADVASWALKLFLVPFFCVHYGMFTAAHGAFVLSGMFGGPKLRLDELDPGGVALAMFSELHIWLPLAALAASHVFSFFWNYLWRGEYRRASLPGLMLKPYARVVVLHLTIIFGGIAATALGSPTWALVLLIGIKVALDVAAHRKEHRPEPGASA